MGHTHGFIIKDKIRVCTKCNTELPNTNEYFNYANKNIGSLSAVCRECSEKELFAGNMRDFTKEEAENYQKSLKRIYKPTGVNIFDLY